MPTEPTSKLLWALKVEATRTEAALAHLIHSATSETLPREWRTLPSGKPTADTITARTIRQLHAIQAEHPGQTPIDEIERLTDRLRLAQSETSIWKTRAVLAESQVRTLTGDPK